MIRIPNFVVRDGTLSSRDFRVLLALLKHGQMTANGSDSYPRVDTLGRETGLNPKTVSAALKRLSSLGVLQTKSHAVGRARCKYTYHLLPWVRWPGYKAGGFVLCSYELATACPEVSAGLVRLAVTMASLSGPSLKCLTLEEITALTGISRPSPMVQELEAGFVLRKCSSHAGNSYVVSEAWEKRLIAIANGFQSGWEKNGLRVRKKLDYELGKKRTVNLLLLKPTSETEKLKSVESQDERLESTGEDTGVGPMQCSHPRERLESYRALCRFAVGRLDPSLATMPELECRTRLKAAQHDFEVQFHTATWMDASTFIQESGCLDLAELLSWPGGAERMLAVLAEVEVRAA